MTGRRFGRLVVVGYNRRQGHDHKWLCRCDCGGEKAVLSKGLKSGNTSSCGCFHREQTSRAKRTHGFTAGAKKDPLYRVWVSMIQRCHNPNDTGFGRYGGRGIVVCDRWRFGENGEVGFVCFLADMGYRPSSKHSLDRIDNQRGYEPDNCRWATDVEQSRNRTITKMVTFQGKLMPLGTACELAGLPYDPVVQRLRKGWSEEHALAAPILRMPPRKKRT